MRNLREDSGEYLSALHNIHSLELVSIEIERVGRADFRTCFSAFRETLTDITLESFATSFDAFVGLVDYFPNITTLRLGSFLLDPDQERVPTLSRPLRGKICLSDVFLGCIEFFDRLAELDLEYEELVLEFGFGIGTRLLESILRVGASTVKCLRLSGRIPCEYPRCNPLYYTPQSKPPSSK